MKSSSDRMPLKGNTQSLFWLSATAQPTVQSHVRGGLRSHINNDYIIVPRRYRATWESAGRGGEGKGGGVCTSASEPKVTECALFVMI